jgi:hypothetical protein
MNPTGRRPFLAVIVVAVIGLSSLSLAAQAPQQGQPYVPKQSDRPEPATGDELGFTPMFDGKTLDGWEGNPKFWRVEDGAMVAEITPESLIKSNTFIVRRRP